MNDGEVLVVPASDNAHCWQWGHLVLGRDCKHIKVIDVDPQVAFAGSGDQVQKGDILLAVDGTYAGFAEDPRALLQSTVNDAINSGLDSVSITVARVARGGSESEMETMTLNLPLIKASSSGDPRHAG